MAENCPVCKTVLIESTPSLDSIAYDCPRCGKYIVLGELKIELPRLFSMQNGIDEEEKRAIASYAIRKMQKKDANYRAPIDEQLIKAILKRPLPSLNEQVKNMIFWIGRTTDYGGKVEIEITTHQSIMGAKNRNGFGFVLQRLKDQGLIEGNLIRDGLRCEIEATLTFDGWEYHEELIRGAIDSRKAFMAMEYGNGELDKIVDDHFKPAVAKTGFDLYRLDKNPKGGSIDDHMRVEIRNSRFLISDLTHENGGAYWEAGYAEGLGKPVIYTCEKKKFDEKKTHFDTNHHLTVKWDAEKIHEAVEMLKATIRATLPDEAKMSDD